MTQKAALYGLFHLGSRYSGFWLGSANGNGQQEIRGTRKGKVGFYSTCSFSAGLQYGDGYVIFITEGHSSYWVVLSHSYESPQVQVKLFPFVPLELEIAGSGESLLAPGCLTFLSWFPLTLFLGYSPLNHPFSRNIYHFIIPKPRMRLAQSWWWINISRMNAWTCMISEAHNYMKYSIFLGLKLQCSPCLSPIVTGKRDSWDQLSHWAMDLIFPYFAIWIKDIQGFGMVAFLCNFSTKMLHRISYEKFRAQCIKIKKIFNLDITHCLGHPLTYCTGSFCSAVIFDEKFHFDIYIYFY